uniref:Double-stranded RNA-binding protein Staufen homolog 2 n=1 Tax=Cacopsylla melanoneura TaxID=428564 RepID=A0A8D8VQD3_9HEMI
MESGQESLDLSQVIHNGLNSHCKVASGSMKEKTPMCLVNELARYNQIPHQYRLTHEDGPAHKKVFTVTLKLGDEEYQADGSSIKKAQHSAAELALNSTAYKHPPEKSTKPVTSRRNITPTVELNALAMKQGEITEYTFSEMPPYAQGSPDGGYHYHQAMFRGRGRGGVRGFRAFKRGFHHTRGGAYPRPGLPYTEGVYRVLLKVSDREYTGCGMSPQSARHDAASQALAHMRELMEQDNQQHGDDPDSCPVCPPADQKSPVSLVHEMALKRKLTVTFEVVEEKGQPHMRMYYTKCTVGHLTTLGEGNGKKISKGKAAELMLQELSQLPEVITENTKSRFKRRPVAASSSHVRGGRRKGARNSKTMAEDGSDQLPPGQGTDKTSKKDEHCLIQQLAVYQQSIGGVEPAYKVVDTKLIPNTKKKEFTMQVTIGDKSIVAISSNKKSAMNKAAHMMLIELGQTQAPHGKKKGKGKPGPGGKNKPDRGSTREKETVEVSNGETTQSQPSGDVTNTQAVTPTPVNRQQVPANTIDLDKTARIASEYLTTGASPTAEALARRPRRNKKQQGEHTLPRDQLNFLARISNFTVTYSDFPNPNGCQVDSTGTPSQGYLSMVNLSTSPPQVCTGVGATIEQSQNEAAISALKFLSDMGLESMSPLKGDTQTPVNNNKTSNRHPTLSNGGTPGTATNSNGGTPVTPTNSNGGPPVTPQNSNSGTPVTPTSSTGSTPLSHTTPNSRNKNRTPRPHPAPVK